MYRARMVVAASSGCVGEQCNCRAVIPNPKARGRRHSLRGQTAIYSIGFLQRRPGKRAKSESFECSSA
jgi:hypothetical protein